MAFRMAGRGESVYNKNISKTRKRPAEYQNPMKETRTMSQITAEEVAQVQAKTREINQTLKASPEMRARYVADPVAFLTGAGLPPAAAQSLVAHIARDKDGGEVSGYDYYDDYYSGYSSSDSDSMEYGN